MLAARIDFFPLADTTVYYIHMLSLFDFFCGKLLGLFSINCYAHKVVMVPKLIVIVGYIYYSLVILICQMVDYIILSQVSLYGVTEVI